MIHDTDRGTIAWMAKHNVAANILMLIFLIGGLYFSYTIKKEVFPEFELDEISVSISYKGATPEEVERSILLPAEEAIRDVDNIRKVTSSATEGGASIKIELEQGADRQNVYQDIKQKIDAISIFPEDATDPVISLGSRKRRVLTITFQGDVDDLVLREIAESSKDKLLSHTGVTQVEMSGARDIEIKIEPDIEKLKSLNLSISQLSSIIQNNAIELPTSV